MTSITGNMGSSTVTVNVNFDDMPSSQIKIIKSVEESQCSFCYCNIKEGEGIILNKCLHTFCRSCLIIAIEESDAPQIKCPVHDEFKCDGCLFDPEIKSLVSSNSYEKYLSRSLIVATKEDNRFFKCLKNDCLGIYILEQGMTNFKCHVCYQFNCVKCKGLHGPELNCPRVGKRNKILIESHMNNAKKKRLEAEAQIETELKVNWNERWEQMKTLIIQSNNSNEEDGVEKSLTNLLESDIIKSTQSFQCAICLGEVEPGEGIILHDCFHYFCRECIQSTIEHSDEPKVQCPFQGTHTSCCGFIQEREVKALVSKEIFDQYLSRSISKAELCTKNSFHCKSINCTGWCEIDGDASSFNCPICNKVNCVKCKSIHEVVSCKEYQNSLKHEGHDEASRVALNKLISGRKAMRCPTCKVVIIKNGGCDGIECRICKTMLCWATRGPRWGPKGVGDTSGGCKCRVNGKKCHPSCSGCH